jgi:hypothetical protein
LPAPKSIPAVSTDIASGTAADLALRDLAANVVLGAVGVQRDFLAAIHLIANWLLPSAADFDNQLI